MKYSLWTVARADVATTGGYAAEPRVTKTGDKQEVGDYASIAQVLVGKHVLGW
jgi:hypothetical protein